MFINLCLFRDLGTGVEGDQFVVWSCRFALEKRPSDTHADSNFNHVIVYATAAF
jgi:hypothetical protein